LIVFGTKSLLLKCPPIQIQIGDSIIKASDSVKNLGVILDKHLRMEKHVNHISKLSFSHIRLISRVRRSLTEKSCEMLVNALVFSRLDYCGSILFGASEKLMAKLKRIVHASFRLVTKLDRKSSILLPLRKFGWLTAKSRIKKRALLLVFKTFHGQSPDYLQSLVQHLSVQSPSSRSLRSHSGLNLKIHGCRSKMGERAFSVYAPKLWNSVSKSIRDSGLRSFKSSIDSALLLSD
jgi:hypothetical protein